jgi:hypothetical protein
MPYPADLMAVDCCSPCNNNFSADEEYFACLIECVLAGTTEVENLQREKIRRTLSKQPKLQKRLESARTEVDGQIYFQPEDHRVKKVLLKLALAHVKYEISEPKHDDPCHFSVKVFPLMNETERMEFISAQSASSLAFLPEVGSRAMQRAFFAFQNDGIQYPWVTVQDGNYAYAVTEDTWNPLVRILIRNYLAVEVGWE